MRRAKMTIAQMRERELERLVAYKTENPTEEDFDEARKIMNSFYRLCGLAERNLYLSNDERFCNRESTKRSEEREYIWSKRLSKQFTETYGLQIFYSGYLPSIGVKYENGCVSEKISRFFYQ